MARTLHRGEWKQPSWNFWKNMPEVETWQACALALNFDPDSLERSPQEWMVAGADVFQSESFPSDEVMRQHENLLRVLEANRFNAQLFTPAHNFKDPVRLPEFAAWCAPVVRDLTGGDIPEELAALAKAAPQAAAKAEAAPVTSASDEDWRAQARVIADECFDRDTANKCRDSLKGYSERVMGEMQERGIKGPRGILDNENTVKREALQGKQWWANKPK